MQLRASRHVLPAAEESHEVGGGDGFDFLAQAAEGEAMNAGDDAAMAEFGLLRAPGTSQDLAFGFEVSEGDFDFDKRQAETLGESCCRRRTDGIHPASEDGDEIAGFVETLGGDPVAVDDAGAALGAELIEEVLPLVDGRKKDQSEQSVVQFIGIADDGPGFFGHLRDGRRVEGAHACRVVGVESAANDDGPGASFFERRVVQKRVGVGVEDFVAEGRGLGGVDGDGAQSAVRHAIENIDETLEIHRFFEAIGDGFVHKRMVGNANFSGQIFSAGDLIGEAGGEQIVGAHALQGRRNFVASGEAQDGESALRVPFPARAEQGRREHGLREHVLDGGRF